MNRKDLLKELAKTYANQPDRLMYEADGFPDLSSARVNGSNSIRCLCPECDEYRTHPGKHKDCSISIDDGRWHCFHCGASGRLLSVQEYKDFTAQQRMIMNRQNRRPKDKQDSPRPKWQPDFLCGNVELGNNPERKAVLRYLTDERKLSLEVLKRAKVTLPDFNDNHSTTAICFNYWDRGEYINWKMRTVGKEWKAFPRGESVPYLADQILRKEVCYITEGEIDALSMLTAGFPETISVPNGGKSHLQWLDAYYDTHFADKKTIYIAADFDEVGAGMIQELVRRLGSERCLIVYWDEDCKDANDELCRYGVEGIQRCVEAAEPVPVTGIHTVRTQPIEQSLDQMITYGLSPGYFSGLRAADEKFRLEPGRFVVVTGLPGDGKSEFVDELTLRLALLHGWKVAYFTPENTPVTYHLAKLISKLAGSDFKFGTRLTPQLYAGCKQWLSQNIYHIMPEVKHDGMGSGEWTLFRFAPREQARRGSEVNNHYSNTHHHRLVAELFEQEEQKGDNLNYYLDDVLAKAREAVQRMGVRQVVIDPYNSIERDADHKSYSDKDWALHVCNACRNFAAHYDCVVYLVAHPRKMDRALLDGRKRRVEMNDIAGSSDFGNKCDYCLVVDRNDDNEYVTVFVDKVKFKQNGSRSKFTLHYDHLTGRYTGCTIKMFRQPGAPPDEKPTVQKDIDWHYFNQTWVNEEGEATIRTYLHS